MEPPTTGQNVLEWYRDNSTSNPETLEGTDNTFWTVYYADADKTLKVRKKGDIIEKVVNGRKSNLE